MKIPALVMLVMVTVDSSAAISVRLVDGSVNNEGRVEVNYNGVWGTICDDGWDTNDAAVICGMAGYSVNGALIRTNGYFGLATGTIWLSNVDCSGSETNVSSCSHSGWGTHTCSHREDAGVICKTYSNDVRLDGNSSIYEGRVALKRGGAWGRICRTNFDTTEATVVCRQMGLPSDNAVAVYNANDGQGSGTVYSISCTGTESIVDDCSFSTPACVQSQLDVSVQCKYTHYDDAPQWLTILLLVVTGIITLVMLVYVVKSVVAYCKDPTPEKQKEKKEKK